MYISFSSGSQPSASTSSPLAIVATTLPVFASVTTDVLLHPEKIRSLALSYAMPVGLSHGAIGHDANTFMVFASST